MILLLLSVPYGKPPSFSLFKSRSTLQWYVYIIMLFYYLDQSSNSSGSRPRLNHCSSCAPTSTGRGYRAELGPPWHGTLDIVCALNKQLDRMTLNFLTFLLTIFVQLKFLFFFSRLVAM